MLRLALLALCTAVTTAGAAPGPERLLAVWHFDEPGGARVLDASGQGFDGRVRGAKRVEGLFGNALEFDGVDDYVACPGVGALQQGAVEAWVKLLSKPKGQTGFVTFGLGYARKNDVAILGHAPTRPGQRMTPWSFGIYGDGWRTAIGPAQQPQGEWHHLVGAWSRDGIRCYVDGQLAAECPKHKRGLPSHAAVLVAASSWNSHTACVVDEVRVYSAPLSAPEREAFLACLKWLAGK